jgi:hypothetical protein
MLRAVHGLGAREFTCELLRRMNEDGETLGANPELTAFELKREERMILFRPFTIQAAFHFW